MSVVIQWLAAVKEWWYWSELQRMRSHC